MATTKASSVSKPKGKEVIAIVGAGIAGLYCAWRLLKHRPKDLHIVILERLNRTGGRLDSDLIEIENETHTGKVTVRDEEGGMRFNYQMEELMQLVGALNLCEDIVPFPMSDDNNRFYLRGHNFTVADAEASGHHIWGEIYNLKPSEQGKSPAALMHEAYEAVLTANGHHQAPANPDPVFWQKLRLEYKWNGTTLNNWQLWGLMRDMGYSEECITMLGHTMGFSAPFHDVINAGEAFQLLGDFPADPTYFTFRDGFSTLPNALVHQLKNMNCKILLSTNVDRIEKASDGYKLELSTSPKGQSYSPTAKNGKGSTTASKVILAIASNAMEHLYNNSPALHDQPKALQLLDDIRSAVNLRLLKINLYYELPWWENGIDGQPPNHYGPNFTDLPLNSAYPFYNTQGITGDRPAALTLYCDFNNTNFWQGLQNVGEMFDSPLQQQHSKSPQVLFPASKAVVAEATRQLQLLFGARWIPQPVMTSYRLWGGEDNFGYAYHQWGIGADDAAVMDRMREPVKGIYTCNETWSDMQGWVNGSLRSANLVLKKMRLPELDSTPCQQPE